MKSWLPSGGENVFQRVKKKTLEAKAKGMTLWPLTIGQPTGPALLSARKAASKLILSDKESVHEYQDNGSPGVPHFAERFVTAHFSPKHFKILSSHSYLPIPGIKPMLGLIPMACGHIRIRSTNYKLHKEVQVMTMTNPGYGTPATWCDYLGAYNVPLPTNVENQFIFSVGDIGRNTNLLMLNFPHNPTGQIATKGFWREICFHCQKNGIRLFNDAAYAALAFDNHASVLAEVAYEFPDLSWCEGYSASKAIANGTGWRVGAFVGSEDFINDIATIKGNTDSGFFAAAAFGALASMEEDFPSVMGNCEMYEDRTEHLISVLEERGMRLAVKPRATFFNTWLPPKKAFDQDVSSAEHFNDLLLAETGLFGIPFGEILRFTVTKPVDSPEWDKAIKSAFDKANVSY